VVLELQKHLLERQPQLRSTENQLSKGLAVTSTSLDSVFEDIADASTSMSRSPTAATIQYLGETVHRSDKPFKFWVVNNL